MEHETLTSAEAALLLVTLKTYRIGDDELRRKLQTLRIQALAREAVRA